MIVDKMHDSIVPLLEGINLRVDYRPDISRQEIIDIIRNYSGLVIRSKTTVDDQLLESANKLEFVARAGAGIDKLDVPAIESRGIKILNAAEGNRDALAEHTVGMLLGLLNNIVKSDREIREGVWARESNRGYELNQMTVGIVGYGHMGQAFAQRLKAFGCRVISYDLYKKGFADDYCEEVDEQKLFDESDVLSLHVPLLSENKGIFNEAYFNRFKKNIYFLNTARGELAPVKDIVKCLKSGKIVGAGLDVLEIEDVTRLTHEFSEEYDYLKGSGRVILTPHVAGWTYESYEKINKVLVEKIKQELEN